MRYARLCLSLFLATSFATSQTPGGVTGGAWKIVASHIQVAFQQLGRNSCTWRFRNADDARTLEAMRFSYTYSTVVISRTPASAPTTQSGTDVLPQPLAPLEEAGGEQNYSIPANCATVTIRVLDAKWM